MSHGAGELMKCFAEYVTFQADLRKNLAFFFFCKMTDDGHHLQFLKKYGTRKMICRVKSKELLRSFSIYQT